VPDDIVTGCIDPDRQAEFGRFDLMDRLENLRAHPSCSLLVDHYTEEWAELWWVRLDGAGRVIEGGDERGLAVALLTEKYPQYRETAPPGAVVALEISDWRMWP
jgi:PPOX class probable F420-dependent enzyme